ncbi:adult-specific rigid cuticular protein 15.7-like [Tachypleus tridentatus]|uniref:adult-specific rigid cuticular protein 15.7-like n=1 Tax=Tachypleus tridentatus TaxID=6853 RepID=UPI003FD457A3
MLAKVIVICVAVGLTSAGGYGGGVGHSTSHRQQNGYGNYNFEYNIADPYGATNHRTESGDGYGKTVGSYGLSDIDGRVRVVDYVADGYGFRANIRTNEPGTSNQDAADAYYNGPDASGYGGSLAIVHAPVGGYGH